MCEIDLVEGNWRVMDSFHKNLHQVLGPMWVMFREEQREERERQVLSQQNLVPPTVTSGHELCVPSPSSPGKACYPLAGRLLGDARLLLSAPEAPSYFTPHQGCVSRDWGAANGDRCPSQITALFQP